MKATKDVKLVTVGKIIEELTEFEKEHSEEDVVCFLPDDGIGYVVGTKLDKDGDVCISLEEEAEDSGCYSVEMLSWELQGYDKQACIYMKCRGSLLSFEECSSLFEYSEEDDVVFCDSVQIGQNEETTEQVRESSWLTEAEMRENEKEERRRKVINKCETIALIILTFCVVVGLIFNVYAIVTHSGVLWENILWSIVFLVCAIFCSLTLYHS